ncbi:MAG: hypothetical protein AABW68_01205 [archaeon]
MAEATVKKRRAATKTLTHRATAQVEFLHERVEKTNALSGRPQRSSSTDAQRKELGGVIRARRSRSGEIDRYAITGSGRVESILWLRPTTRWEELTPQLKEGYSRHILRSAYLFLKGRKIEAARMDEEVSRVLKENVLEKIKEMERENISPKRKNELSRLSEYVVNAIEGLDHGTNRYTKIRRPPPRQKKKKVEESEPPQSETTREEPRMVKRPIRRIPPHQLPDENRAFTIQERNEMARAAHEAQTAATQPKKETRTPQLPRKDDYNAFVEIHTAGGRKTRLVYEQHTPRGKVSITPDFELSPEEIAERVWYTKQMRADQWRKNHPVLARLIRPNMDEILAHRQHILEKKFALPQLIGSTTRRRFRNMQDAWRNWRARRRAR